jgi:hypothetical protein
MENDMSVLDYTGSSTPVEQKYVEIEALLKEHICDIEFKKKSGEHSTMVATLNPNDIEQHFLFKPDEGEPRIVTWDTITVWSKDRGGWRAMKTDLIEKVVIHNG